MRSDAWIRTLLESAALFAFVSFADDVEGQVAGDRAAPAVEIHFPLANSITDAATIHVTGSASDESGVRAVRVNGVYASTTDAFAHWSVCVPLPLGAARISVESEDLLGNLDSDAAEILVHRPGPFLLDLRELVDDLDHGRVLVVDSLSQSVVSVDLTTGLRTNIVSAGDAQSPVIHWPTGAALAPDGGRCFVSSLGPGAGGSIHAVDTRTGERVLVSGAAKGHGPAFAYPFRPVFDSVFNRLLVLDFYDAATITAVDLASGDRRSLRIQGHPWAFYTDLVVDSASQRAFVLDAHARSVLDLDLESGAATVVSDSSHGSGPDFLMPAKLSLDRERNRVLVLDTSRQEVLAVDLASGDRTVTLDISGWEDVQQGAMWSMAFDGTNDRVISMSADDVFTVGETSAIRTTLSENARGVGREFVHPSELALSPDGKRLAVRDNVPVAGARLISVDLSTGDRYWVPDVALDPFSEGIVFEADGESVRITDREVWNTITLDSVDLRTGAIRKGPQVNPLGEPGVSDLELLPDGKRALVSYYIKICIFDLAGRSIELSGNQQGNGPHFSGLSSIRLAPHGDSLFALDADHQALHRVDMATGDRLILSSPSVGSGPQMQRWWRLDLEARHDRVLITDPLMNALFEVRPMTGARAFVAHDDFFDPSTRVGAGPFFLEPYGLCVDQERGVAFTGHAGSLKGILAVELNSGDRVLVSR